MKRPTNPLWNDSSRRFTLGAIKDLRVLWLAVLLLLGIDIGASHLVAEPKSSTNALVDLGPSGARADVVLLGSSRVRPISAERLSAAANGVSVANLAFNGSGLADYWLMVERHLTPEVLTASGTRLVVLGTSVADLNDRFRNPGVAATTWSFAELLVHWARNGTDYRTTAWLHSNPPCRWSGLLRFRRRGKFRALIRSQGRKFQRWLLQSPPAAAPPPKSSDRVVESVLDNATSIEVKGARSFSDIPPPTSGIRLQDYEVGGVHTEALTNMARYFHENGVTLALVHIPVSTWYQNSYGQRELDAYQRILVATARKANLPLFVLRGKSHGLVDDDYFREDGPIDGHHLVQERGRIALAESIGHVVVRPLLVAPSQARGFSAGRVEALR